MKYEKSSNTDFSNIKMRQAQSSDIESITKIKVINFQSAY